MESTDGISSISGRRSESNFHGIKSSKFHVGLQLQTSILQAMRGHGVNSRTIKYSEKLHELKPDLEALNLRPLEVGKRVDRLNSTVETRSIIS